MTEQSSAQHNVTNLDFQQALRQSLLSQQQQQQQQQPPQGLKKKSNKKKAPEVNDADDNYAAAAGEDGGQAMVFPVKLHRMLTQIEAKAHSNEGSQSAGGEEDASVVSWQPHGRCFLVHDKDAFVQRFLPSYFRQSKWASFQRQLNIYGFQRLTAGRDRGAYYHELFLRGHPELATRIHRMKLKGIGQGRHRTNAELEPNFYRMKPVGCPGGVHVDSAVDVVHHQAGNAASNAANAASINVLQLFNNQGNANVGTSSSGNAMGGGGGPSAAELSNLFFLTGNNDMAGNNQGLQGNANGGNGQFDNFQAAQQGSANTSAFLLANLFNAANNNSNPGGNVAGNTIENFGNHGGHTNTNTNFAHDTSNDEPNQWSASSLFAGNSNLAPLLQNTDANLITTATLMQYMAENNSDASQSPPAASSSGAYQSQQLQLQQHQNFPQQGGTWSTLASGGLTGMDTNASTMSGNVHHGGTTGLNNSNSSNDLVNTFNFDGPSLRRMSAAAMSTLLSAHFTGRNESDNVGGSTSHHTNIGNNNAAAFSSGGNSNTLGGIGQSFDSNPNLLLFSSLQSRNSSGNLMQHFGDSDTAGASFSATHALNRLAASTANNGTSGNFGGSGGAPVPAPASQQLAFLQQHGSSANASASSASAVAGGNGNSGLLFADLFGTRGVASASHPANPTFLDSVYEPIPIKEDGSNAGQQKLSGSRGGSANSSGSGDPKKGFHSFSDTHHYHR